MTQTPRLTHSLRAHLLPALVLNSVIALGLTVFGEHAFTANWVYAQCIGLSIGGLIHQASQRLAPQGASQWRRLVLIVPVAAVLGFGLGTLLGDVLVGAGGAGYWLREPHKAWGYATLSLGVGALLTYFFVSRAQLAQERERAEAALRQAAESRLTLLQSQLEPHMLFNTLANLHALIGIEPARAQHMLDHLVSYLRATLGGSRAPLHPLQAEFDRLRDYLELMSVRMGPRLHYTLDLPPALAAQQVPALILQPLVENALQHGLAPTVAGGHITVQAALNQGQLTLSVQDTGAGLNASHSPPLPCNGFGLVQVRERLATLYGEQGTLELIATRPSGTRASVTFPSQNRSEP